MCERLHSIMCACRFEKCWPALQRNVHGVILVYDCENEQQVVELETW